MSLLFACLLSLWKREELELGARASPAGAAETVPKRPFLPNARRALWSNVPLCSMLRPATASPPGGLLTSKAQQVKAALEVVGVVGARSLVLDCCAILALPHGGSVIHISHFACSRCYKPYGKDSCGLQPKSRWGILCLQIKSGMREMRSL